MNKKVTLTIVALLVLLVGFFGIKAITDKDVQQGNKTITIEVVSNVDNLNEKIEIKTDEEKLGPALLNEEGYEIVDGMVTTVKGINLGDSDSEYWHISINGEDAQVGANDLIIKDGDTIKFERIKFR